jgi:WD40 repeat protein
MTLGTSASSTARTFDVFLSHNSRDKPIVERAAERLRRAGLEPWLDLWALSPGGRWQEELAAGMRASSACAYFVGPNGEGDWEREELALAVDRAALDRRFRLFPVLLPGVPEPYDRTTLPPFLATRTWVDLRRGIDDTRAFQGLVNAVKGIPFGPAVPLVARDDACPYRGLQTFDESHADLFFGRDGDIQAVLEQLKASRFLAVLGPSGSGKSSLVRAGVIPALRRGAIRGSDGWTIEVVRLGGRPLETLAARLIELDVSESMHRTVDELERDDRTLHLASTLFVARRPASTRLVWVIDQAEELFTLGQDDAQRAQLIANLVYAASIPDGPAAVILTLRADFYSRCAAYPALAALLAGHQYLVGPMDEAGLRAAVEDPARAVGLEFESGLVDTILGDVASAPGTLPLLEHALFELWERRRGGMLTLEAYRETGGVQGAIAQRAETIYDRFDAPQQAIARRALLRLTQAGEGTEDTRRRATLREVAGLADEAQPVEEVVRNLADARLLTTSADQQTGERWVDISHEALIRGWPRLRGWLDEDRAGLRVHRRITEAAEEWERLGRDDGVLYRGARLAGAAEWRTANEGLLNGLEREFLDASVALQERERAGRERVRRRVTLAALTTATIFLLLAVFSAVQWQDANRQRDDAKELRQDAVTAQQQAERERDVALARQLAARAGNFLTRPDQGLLLSLEANLSLDANRLSAEPDVRGSLLSALTNTRLATYLLHTGYSQVALALSPDGEVLATSGGNRTILWHVARRAPIGEPLQHEGVVWSVAFSPDGGTLATGTQTGAVVLWDVASQEPIGKPLLGHSGAVYSVAFTPDGATLASGSEDGTVALWDVAHFAPIAQAVQGDGDAVDTVAVSPDGETLASGGVGGTVVLWNVPSLAPISKPLGDPRGVIWSIAFSPDGKILASGDRSGTVVLWDVASQTPIGERIKQAGGISSLAFSSDGEALAVGSADGTIVLWDVASRDPIGEPLRAHAGAVGRVLFSPDSKTLVSGSEDGTVIMWDIANPAPIADAVHDHSGAVQSVAFSPDGKILALSHSGRNVVLWDIAKHAPIDKPLSVVSVAFSPDGEVLASGTNTGEIVLWDVGSPAPFVEQHLGLSVAFSPDGKILACIFNSGDNGRIVLFDVKSRSPIGELLRQSHRFKSLAFSPDGSLLASLTYSGTIVMWDVASQAPNSEPFSGRSFAFSPDGAWLAVAGDGRYVHIWDVAHRARTGEPLQHDSRVTSVAFSRDGETLAAGTATGAIVLWDTASSVPIGEPLRGHSGPVNSVAFSPDGATLVSGGEDETTILWSVDPVAWSAAACEVANRNLSLREWRQYVGDEPYHATCPDLPAPHPDGTEVTP